MTRKQVVREIQVLYGNTAAQAAEEILGRLRVGGDAYPQVLPNSFKLGSTAGGQLTVFYTVSNGHVSEEKGDILPFPFK